MEGRLATKMDSQGTQIPSAKVNLRDLTSRVIRVESSLDARIDATVSRAIGAAVDRAASNRLSPQLFPPLSTATDISQQSASGLAVDQMSSATAASSSLSLSQPPCLPQGLPPPT